MDTKLTLRMDSNLIEKAKKWARDRNVSLSQAIASFFETITASPAARDEEVSPWVRNLSVGKKSGRHLTDKKIRKLRYADLERKHR